MGATDDISAIETARKIRERKNLVNQTVAGATSTPTPPKKKKKSVRKKGAPSLETIKASKHKGLEGEAAYGQRMQPPAIDASKSRFGQTGGNSGNPGENSGNPGTY